MKKPLWIFVEGHFEGHQGHWADCFFSNATGDAILSALREPNSMFGGASWVIRPMTNEELTQYPEAVTFTERVEREYAQE